MTRYFGGGHRMAGWLDGPIEHALTCPRGHHIADGMIVTGEQPVRCRYQWSKGGAACGLLVWVVVTRVGAVYAAEVDVADVQIIKGHANVQDTLKYLGAPVWPRRRGPNPEAA